MEFGYENNGARTLLILPSRVGTRGVTTRKERVREVRS